MSVSENQIEKGRRPLRLWPGVVIVALQWLLRFVVPVVAPSMLQVGVLAGIAGGLLVILWWLFFSRAPWPERLGAVALMAAAVALTYPIVHPSIATGMMGMMLVFFSVPILSLLLVAWAAFSERRRLATGPRWALLVPGVVAACAAWTLVRTGGFTGDLDHEFAWRWSETPEDRLLAQSGGRLPAPAVAPGAQRQQPAAPAPTAAPAAPAAAERTAAPAAEPPPAAASSAEPASSETAAAVERAAPPAPPPADAPAPAAAPAATPASAWPGFRGPARDGIVRGSRIATDWSASPPVELWRKPVGPGWSSFAVDGDVFYTQEQRGEDEVVAAYRLSDGEPVWMHADKARFWESNAGAGPRATPTLHAGRLYTLGATGILNALDAATGKVLWSRNAAEDTEATLPGWGFSGSPLVVGDLVVVPTAGQLVAYEAATGKPRWFGPEGGGGYSSPHPVTLDGVEQILFMSNKGGAAGLAPADGKVLWQHELPFAARIVQPAVTADGLVLLPEGDTKDLHQVAVRRGPKGWAVEERWVSNGLKPYFNDFVVHEGHAYGFDGFYLSAIGLDDGKRTWKGGRYGNGQLVLLADQDALLVLSEKGELALVGATPGEFKELARAPAIDGKTWNHPVLVGDVLLVRNDREMAAFRLPTAGG
jgi:outer membrane protein assembly factor BamB